MQELWRQPGTTPDSSARSKDYNSGTMILEEPLSEEEAKKKGLVLVTVIEQEENTSP